MSESNLTGLTNKRLNKLVRETQETLEELKQEVTRREMEQKNHEIDELESHMEHAELSLKTIRVFVSMLLKDRDRNKS